MKRKNLIKTGIIIIIFALIVGSVLFYNLLNEVKKSDLRKETYNKFTCGCCEDTLKDADCLLAKGMRSYIDDLFKKGSNKEEVFLQATKEFGLTQVKDKEEAIKIGAKFAENPPEDRPIINITPTIINLGTVSETNTISSIADYRIRNKGKSNLLINKIHTSCSCLFTSVFKDGKEGPRLGRFSQTYGWSVIVEPGEEIILRAYYNPRENAWFKGYEERWIYIASNDPLNPEETVGIKVNHIV